jgi:hypothetical protein
MKRRLQFFLFLMALTLWAALGATSPSAAAHKFHASFTRIERNAETKSIEITVRVFADDLEAILSRREKRRIQADQIPDAEKVVGGYVRERLQVRDGDGAEISLSWVGMEVKVDSVWIYVEGKSPGGLQASTVVNTLFFDLFDDQVNTVSVKDGDRRGELIFRRGDKAKPALSR